MKQPTVSNITRQFRNKENNKGKKKKIRRPLGCLTESWDHLKSMSPAVSSILCIQSLLYSMRKVDCRYVKGLDVVAYVSWNERTVLLSKNLLYYQIILRHVSYGLVHTKIGHWHNGLTLWLQMSFVLLSDRKRIVSKYGEKMDEGCIKNTLFLRISREQFIFEA